MKKTLLALMMLSAAAAYAGEAEDRLLSVQSVYRAALHEQNSNDSKIISLQSDLESAQRRLQAAQSDIDRLKGEIQTALAQKEMIPRLDILCKDCPRLLLLSSLISNFAVD